jgi:hypothetical protein
MIRRHKPRTICYNGYIVYVCYFESELDELEAEQLEYDREEMGLDVPTAEESPSGD